MIWACCQDCLHNTPPVCMLNCMNFLLLCTGTHRQDVVFSPEILKLRAWMRCPGLFSMQEALLRTETEPVIAGMVFNLISGPLTLLNYKLDPQQLDQVLPACLSYVATVRKVMYPVTHHVFANKHPGPPPLIFTPLQVGTLIFMHIQLINTMNDAMRADCSNQAGCSSSSRTGSSCGSSNSGSSSDIGSSSTSVLPVSGTAIVVQGVSNQAGRVQTAVERKILFHRVQAVMMAGAVQLCQFQVESGEKVQGRDQEPCEWVKKIFRAINDPGNGLEEFLQDSILSLHNDPARAQQEVGPRWEEYARSNFDRHFLPGCCYMGCTNLTGVTEAALPMRLCGGCGRTRYCGVACQRGAWLEGGHSTQCGKK